MNMAPARHKIDGLPIYFTIYAALLALLVATVIAGAQDLGPWNTVVSLAIAVIKAFLVILFFMHVRHSSKLVWIFAAAAFLWLGLLLGLTMTDFASRQQPAPSSVAHITLNE
jgi:cytochrome c oxidase subunit 4